MGSLPARISPLIVLLAIGHWVAVAETQHRVSSSLLLLIDTSGSMGDAVGTANPEVKIEVAKQAAVEALGRAAGSGSVEGGGAGVQRGLRASGSAVSGLHP